MPKDPNNGPYRELEERAFLFAQECRTFVRSLSRDIANTEDGRPLVRASGSQVANYIEANDALIKKDFVHRVKICRKEAKESCLWLRFCHPHEHQEEKRVQLIDEAEALRKIFNAIIDKSL